MQTLGFTIADGNPAATTVAKIDGAADVNPALKHCLIGIFVDVSRLKTTATGTNRSSPIAPISRKLPRRWVEGAFNWK